MNKKQTFSVCISSVIIKEANFIDYRFIAKSVIEKLGLEGIRNPEDIRNQINFENELHNNSDLFVLLLGTEPSNTVEKELLIALSKGIPILIFVKAAYNRKKGIAELPLNVQTNLFRISPELYNKHLIVFDNCEDLSSKLEAELNEVITRKMVLSPLIGLDPPVAYTEGVKLIGDAKYRIILSQKTSILILGPRKVETEKVFYDELLRWLNRDREKSTFFLHYFSLEETKKEMKNKENYSLKEARENMEKLFQKYKNNNNFSIRVTKNVEIVSHLIADTGLGLNFWIGGNRYYLFLPCFMTKDSELQKIISSVQRVGTPISETDIDNIYK